MKYFQTLIPTIEDNESIYFDMFFKFDIANDIDQEFLINYEITDGETLQDIALEIYDDPQLWWIIALLNKIENSFFDMPNSDQYIQKIAVDFASINPLFWTGEDTDLFWTGSDNDLFWYEQEDYLIEYEKATVVNDTKRNIIVLKAEYLSEIISLVLQKANT